MTPAPPAGAGWHRTRSMRIVGHCDPRSSRVLSPRPIFHQLPSVPTLSAIGTVTPAPCGGLFLEAFQLTLYPDWLGIRFVDEFVRISALSHIAYGASLGLIARWGFRQTGPP